MTAMSKWGKGRYVMWGKRDGLLNDVVRANPIEKRLELPSRHLEERHSKQRKQLSVKTPEWEWCVYHILVTSRMPEWLQRSKLRGE